MSSANRSKNASDLALDHIVVGVRDLEQGKRWFEERSGVEPIDGGPHPGLGTHNALFTVASAVHPLCYVEILAPDPKQNVTSPVAAGLGEMEEPALFHWALRTSDLAELAQQLSGEGIETGTPFDASRRRPDGGLLEWQLLGLHEGRGAAPFFIDWLDCRHPAESAPVLGALEAFHAALPLESRVAKAIGARTEAVELVAGSPSLQLVLTTQRGQIRIETPDPIGFRLR